MKLTSPCVNPVPLFLSPPTYSVRYISGHQVMCQDISESYGKTQSFQYFCKDALDNDLTEMVLWKCGY